MMCVWGVVDLMLALFVVVYLSFPLVSGSFGFVYVTCVDLDFYFGFWWVGFSWFDVLR